MEKNKIYIQFWNAETDEYEWREFSTDEIDELMRFGFIDEDLLGYAMGIDQAAFDQALIRMTELNRPWCYKEFADCFLSLTDKEIRIKA